MTKIIVAGTRRYTCAVTVSNYLVTLPFTDPGWELVTGMCANSPDMHAYRWAKKMDMVVHEFPADWGSYGYSAGHRRNREMAEFADKLIAFWDGKSPGTRGMIGLMHDMEKPYIVVTGER